MGSYPTKAYIQRPDGSRFSAGLTDYVLENGTPEEIDCLYPFKHTWAVAQRLGHRVMYRGKEVTHDELLAIFHSKEYWDRVNAKRVSRK